MFIYFFITMVIVVLIYLLSLYNKFVKLNNMVKEAFSTMDVYLKKRWDLIPNLVETVKGYSEHEKNTLEEIVKLRNNTYDSLSMGEKIDTNEQLKVGVNKLFALAENYPDLKANINYIDLSNNLVKVEDDILNSRKYYNGAVKMYNIQIQKTPNNFVAKLFGFKECKMFEVNTNEKENVRIDV